MAGRFLIICLLYLIAGNTWAQNPLVEVFQQLGKDPSSVSFQNPLEINREGGHIQGIQCVHRNQQEHLILSGSSSTISYYATVKNGQVVRVDTLLHRPYKHAGGFQVNDGLLAIGVEDNEAKNTSQVLIYDFSDPMNPSDEPLRIIQRDGETERATAGCVAIAKFQQQYLVLVGDWDTRHLDLYQLPIDYVHGDRIHNSTAKSAWVKSIALKEHPRDGWIDDAWWPYQNINLFNSEGSLYLIGLGINDQLENVADVFTVSLHPELELTKVATRTFPMSEQSNFKWGAGVTWQADSGKMRILSTSYTIDQSTIITIYQ